MLIKNFYKVYIYQWNLIFFVLKNLSYSVRNVVNLIQDTNKNANWNIYDFKYFLDENEIFNIAEIIDSGMFFLKKEKNEDLINSNY